MRLSLLLAVFAVTSLTACALDDVSETSSEVLTTGPDFIESAVSDPPATATLGTSLSVSDTVTNQGTLDAPASQTVYYLSSTATTPFNKVLRFTTQRSIGSLTAGTSSSGAVTVTIPKPTTTSAYSNGTFYVVACADYGNAVPETSEANNCAASASAVVISSPDLVITGASEPPADVLLGQQFSITDTVADTGSGDAGAFNNAFYLSTTNAPPYNFVLRFMNQRSVTSVGAGSSNTGTTSVFAPAGYATNPAYFGTFYLVTCADYGNAVGESSEGNNCFSSTGTVYVHGPDLVLSSPTISTTTVDAGGSVTFGDTITNPNTTDSPASDVGYVLSTDSVLDSIDGIISPCSSTGGSYATRSVPAVLAGTSNTGTATVGPLCVDDGTSVHVPAPGSYYVFVCADIYKTVFETNEHNNCVLLPSQLQVSTSCGNSVLESGEQCDDGNNNNGDGCSASCATQTLTSVTVTPADATVPKGLTQQYVATANYSDGWTNDVTSSSTWGVGSTVYASISSTGLLTAVEFGSTTVSGTYQMVTGSTNVTIGAAVIVDLAINPAGAQIARLTKQQYEAVAIYSDATTAVVTPSTTWSSSNTNAATIDATGLASGLQQGNTNITGTYGTFTDTVQLTVTNATLSSIAVTPANATMAKNTTQQYTATGTFSDATTQDLTTQVTWSSSTAATATVDSTGLVSAKNAGTTSIRALFVPASVTGSTNLTVVNGVLQSIAITPVNPSLARTYSLQFTATGTYFDGTTTFTQNVTNQATWTSSSTSVASIGGTTGNATGKLAGTTTITAKIGSGANQVTGTTTLTVTNATLLSIAITPNPVTTTKGATVQLTAIGTFSDATTLNITKQVSWTSSKKNTVSLNSQGRLKAVKTGTAVVTATKTSVQGTVNVTVN